MMLAVCIIDVSLQNSYRFTVRNIDNIEMVNIAEAYINETKEMIRSSENDDYDFHEEKQVNKYKIESEILKNEEYKQCYELKVRVIHENKNIEVNTYVTKQ